MAADIYNQQEQEQQQPNPNIWQVAWSDFYNHFVIYKQLTIPTTQIIFLHNESLISRLIKPSILNIININCTSISHTFNNTIKYNEINFNDKLISISEYIPLIKEITLYMIKNTNDLKMKMQQTITEKEEKIKVFIFVMYLSNVYNVWDVWDVFVKKCDHSIFFCIFVDFYLFEQSILWSVL